MTAPSPHGQEPLLMVRGVTKSFTMHLQGGQRLPVLTGLSFDVARGECVVLSGASGVGKSSILKMVYGNYGVQDGSIVLRRDSGPVDLATASAREMLAARRDTMGYVSQFLRVVPRVPALQVVAEPLLQRGVEREQAEARAGRMLSRVGIDGRLWALPPATFSGGEQQRVNIARGFVTAHPLLLLDEPTSSLDSDNRQIVVELIRERRDAGVGILGIFHDAEVRSAVADRYLDVTAFAPAGATVAT